MKIVYDMRTGDIIERSAEPRRDSDTESHFRPSTPTPETALQLAEYCWSDQRAMSRPEFLACYFDEVGDNE